MLDIDLLLLGVHDHRPELEDRERPLVTPGADLAEEHRSRAGQLDQDGGHQDERGDHDQDDRGDHQIKGALEEPGAGGERRRGNVDHREPRKVLHVGSTGDQLVVPGNDGDADLAREDLQHLDGPFGVGP